MVRAPAPCLLTILLAFYFLVPSSAVPLSRVQRKAIQEAGQMPSVEGSTLEPKMRMERFVMPENDESMTTTSARMAFETQDYAPPGSNNHHKPPGWR